MWESRYLGQSLHAWEVAAGFALIVFIALMTIRHFVCQILNKGKSRAAKLLSNMLSEIHVIPLIMLSLFLSTVVLNVPDRVEHLFGRLILLVFIVQLALWSNRVVRYWLDRWLKERASEHPDTLATINVLNFVVRVSLWSILLLFGLEMMGVDITGVIAGLGIGGVAIAFAVQNILTDIFASIAIVLDKPFVVGDAIQVENLSGTIEKIGIKTTRLRAESGEQLIFGNTDLLKARIRNFKRMSERRVVLNFNIAAGMPAERVEKIPALVGAIIAKQEKVKLEGVYLIQLADSALKFEAAYEVLSPEFKLHLSIQQKILLEVYRELFQR